MNKLSLAGKIMARLRVAARAQSNIKLKNYEIKALVEYITKLERNQKLKVRNDV